MEALDRPLVPPVAEEPDPGAVQALFELLKDAAAPIAVVGGADWSPRAAHHFANFAFRHGIPVAAAFRRQDSIDNKCGVYAGQLGYGPNPKLQQRVREADLILAVGTRLGESTTDGYTLITPDHPGQTVVHVHPDPNELGHDRDSPGFLELLRGDGIVDAIDHRLEPFLDEGLGRAERLAHVGVERLRLAQHLELHERPPARLLKLFRGDGIVDAIDHRLEAFLHEHFGRAESLAHAVGSLDILGLAQPPAGDRLLQRRDLVALRAKPIERGVRKQCHQLLGRIARLGRQPQRRAISHPVEIVHALRRGTNDRHFLGRRSRGSRRRRAGNGMRRHTKRKAQYDATAFPIEVHRRVAGAPFTQTFHLFSDPSDSNQRLTSTGTRLATLTA